MFYRSDWKRHPFMEIQVGEDSRFLENYIYINAKTLFEDYTIAKVHPGNTSPKKVDHPDYRREGEMDLHAPSRKVLLSYLTWNTWKTASLPGWRRLMEEARRLRQLGVEVCVTLTDNGSEVWPLYDIRDINDQFKDIPVVITRYDANRGNSIARNHVIKMASDYEYTFFLDGDIWCVPFSAWALLQNIKEDVGVLGLFSGDWTEDVGKASSELVVIPPRCIETRLPGTCAWTQYGLFRNELWKAGIHFDTAPGLFDGPGWGFEDNDLGMQISKRGFKNQCAVGACTYAHLKYHSSLDHLDSTKWRDLFEKRRRYLVKKWGADPLFEREILSIQNSKAPE